MPKGLKKSGKVAQKVALAQRKESQSQSLQAKRAERLERKRRKRDREKHNDDEDKQFAAQLAARGFRIATVEADGNCLFRALGDQLVGRERDHATIRRDVLRHEELAGDHFKCFVEDDEPWDDYVARLRRDAEWGGNMELVAAANHFRVHVCVHQLNAPVLEIRADVPDGGRARKTAHLSYHGESHYNSVRRRDDGGGDDEPPRGLPHLDGGEAPPAADQTRRRGRQRAASDDDVVDLVVDADATDKPPLPRAACPCGSGKRYRRCCRAADLARDRRRKAAADEPPPDESIAPALGSLSI